MAQNPITSADVLSRPDLMEFLMNYIERRNKEQRREPQRLITPRREPQQGGPSGGVLSNIFNVRTQEVGPPSLPMRGLQNLMNPGVEISPGLTFDPTGGIGGMGGAIRRLGKGVTSVGSAEARAIRGLPAQGKGFSEEAFPVALRVRVVFDDGTSMVDAIKGLNGGHALSRARDNWPTATRIIPLGLE